ncbi:MAG: hypothetical protein QM706_15020 [Nitrospira sp.]
MVLTKVGNEFEDEELRYGEPGSKQGFYESQNDATALIESMTPAKGSTIKIITSYGDWGWEQTESDGSPSKWIKWLRGKITGDQIKLKVVAYLGKGDVISQSTHNNLKHLLGTDGSVEFRRTDKPQISHYVLCSNPPQLWIEEEHRDGSPAQHCFFVEHPYPETFNDVEMKFNALFADSSPLKIAP